MTFELKHASLKTVLVPNNSTVNIKLLGEPQPLEGYDYRGFDDDKVFILVTKKLENNKSQNLWIPINAIAYIERVSEAN